MFSFLSRTSFLLLFILSFSTEISARKAIFEAFERITKDRIEKMTGNAEVDTRWIQ